MSSIESTEDLAESLKPLFRMSPAYNVGDGLIQMTSAYWEREILGNDARPLDWDVAGKPLVLLFTLWMPFLFCLLALECAQDGGSGGLIGRGVRLVRDSWESFALRANGVRREGAIAALDDGLDDSSGALDDDVVKERELVARDINALRRTAPVLFEGLWKIYPPSVGSVGAAFGYVGGLLGPTLCCLCDRMRGLDRRSRVEERKRGRLPKRAVRGLTTTVREGETYALLGSNGAGKTTTLSALTGDITATYGRAYVAGHCVTGSEREGVTKARRFLGYCPQVDPLMDLMTARETLDMFAKVRGIPDDKRATEVDSLLRRLTLLPHAEKTAESLSGGNKRKLSLGIALVGNPKVLLIDESSSGLDPVAKRTIWDLVADAAVDRSVILTTHR